MINFFKTKFTKTLFGGKTLLNVTSLNKRVTLAQQQSLWP